MGSLVSVTYDMCFLPAMQFLACYAFRSRVRFRHGSDRQTNGRTDSQIDNGHQYVMPTLWAGRNKSQEDLPYAEVPLVTTAHSCMLLLTSHSQRMAS